MRVEHYSFGKITIDGQPYPSDVIIYPERVDSSWRRKQGHNLQIEDIAGVIKPEPGVVIIGTGYFGLMKVPNETVSYLETKGIMVYVERTGKAVELYNELQKNKTVIAALHLTC